MLMRHVAAASLAFGLMAGTQAVAQDSKEMKELNFGIISTESTQNLRPQWDPFLADMEKALGTKVKAFFAPDYAGIIEGMRFKKVDVAWFGNKSAMEAVDRAGGEVFVQSVDAGGNPGYWSLLLVHKDSPIKSVQDVLKCDKSLNFGNGDPNSTSGFLVPSYYVFAQNNVDPKNCFKTVRGANHETNALAVANKQVDVATGNTENMDRMKKTNPQGHAQLREIWRSPLIPADPIVYRGDLDPDLKGKIKGFFLGYGRLGPNVEKERQVLNGLSWAPFRDSSNAQLYPIRQLELYREKAKLEADGRMAAAEKQQKLGEIEKKLGNLQVLAAASPMN